MPWPKGVPRSPETKAKIAASGVGRVHSEETKRQMSESATGRKHSPETVEKIRQARLHESATLQGEERRARFASNGMKGKRHSPETREKMRKPHKPHSPETIAKLRGQKRSPETRAKISAIAKQRTHNPMKGRKHSAETRAKMSRPCTDEMKEFLRARVVSPETRQKMRESATRRYATMRAIGQIKATKPEIAVAAMLRSEGRNFIEQHPVEGFVVDFFLPDEHLVIEVNGCFWHGCARCGFAEKNPDVRRKDRQKAAALRKAGYALLVVWEHDTKSHV